MGFERAKAREYTSSESSSRVILNCGEETLLRIVYE
jgi:hypothetical protein